MNTCGECGYDLTGLDLPRACPECGVQADPPDIAHETVVAWYATWRGLLLWKAPGYAARHLHDPRCRRVARRRLLWGLLIPWIAFTAALVGLSTITVVRRVEVSWESPAAPGVRVRTHTVTREDALFAFNLHLFEEGLFWSPPAGATRHERLLSQSFQFKWQPPDVFVWLHYLWPTVALSGLAVCIASFALLRLARTHRVGWRAVPGLLVPATCFYAVGVGLAVGVSTASDIWPSVPAWPGFVLACTALGFLSLGWAYTVVALLRTCRPARRPWPMLFLLAAFATALAMPLLSLVGAAIVVDALCS